MYLASPTPPDGQPSPGPHEDPRRALGRLGERLAAAYLQRLGFAVIERNVRTRHGEIDLIAANGQTLVFVEVKTRRLSGAVRSLQPQQLPLVWLKPRQRARLRRLASGWLCDEAHPHPRSRTIRFDAVGVVVDRSGSLVRLDHIEGAW